MTTNTKSSTIESSLNSSVSSSVTPIERKPRYSQGARTLDFSGDPTKHRHLVRADKLESYLAAGYSFAKKECNKTLQKVDEPSQIDGDHIKILMNRGQNAPEKWGYVMEIDQELWQQDQNAKAKISRAELKKRIAHEFTTKNNLPGVSSIDAESSL